MVAFVGCLLSDGLVFASGKSRFLSSASDIRLGNGQPRPSSSARFNAFETVLREQAQLEAMLRWLIP